MPLTTTANRTPPLIATLTGPAFTVPDPSAPLFQRPGVGKNAPAKVSSPPIVNFVHEPKASASSTVLTNHNSVTMPFIAASPPGSSGAMTSPRLDHSHNFGMGCGSKVTDGFGPRGQDSSGQSETRGGTNSDPTFFGNRDRGEPHGSAPPTPPDIRVRIRRFDGLGGSRVGDRSHAECRGLARQTENIPTPPRRCLSCST